MFFDLENYCAGGYFITHYVPRPDYLDASMMPESIVSVSESVATIMQEYWGSSLERSREKAISFGIPAEKHLEFMAWSRKNEDVGHPNTFYTLAGARAFIQRFIPQPTQDLLLLGVALHKDLVPNFIEQTKQVVYDPVREVYIHSDYAASRVLKRGDTPPPGEILGFEMLGYEAGYWSWLRNGLEKDAYYNFGIKPNQYGLIGTYIEAKRVHQWIIQEQDANNFKVEPMPYAPWLIMRYTLRMTGQTDKLTDRTIVPSVQPETENQNNERDTREKAPGYLPRRILQ